MPIIKTYIDEEGYEVIMWSDGSKYWYKNGLLHRENDKPAVVFRNGTKHWLKNGECHRDGDKPAIVATNGLKQWLKNGFLHRENNAASFLEGKYVYYLNHVFFSKEKDYWIKLLLLEY